MANDTNRVDCTPRLIDAIRYAAEKQFAQDPALAEVAIPGPGKTLSCAFSTTTTFVLLGGPFSCTKGTVVRLSAIARAQRNDERVRAELKKITMEIGPTCGATNFWLRKVIGQPATIAPLDPKTIDTAEPALLPALAIPVSAFALLGFVLTGGGEPIPSLEATWRYTAKLPVRGVQEGKSTRSVTAKFAEEFSRHAHLVRAYEALCLATPVPNDAGPMAQLFLQILSGALPEP